jgi:hypothetical protein
MQALDGVYNFLQRAVLGAPRTSHLSPDGVGHRVGGGLTLFQNHRRRLVGSALKRLKRNHVVNMKDFNGAWLPATLWLKELAGLKSLQVLVLSNLTMSSNAWPSPTNSGRGFYSLD